MVLVLDKRQKRKLRLLIFIDNQEGGVTANDLFMKSPDVSDIGYARSFLGRLKRDGILTQTIKRVDHLKKAKYFLSPLGHEFIEEHKNEL